MWDFLTFNSFITQDILIFFYYIGATIVPVILWFKKDTILKKISIIEIKDKNKTTIFLTILVVFLFIQLCWRMVFETMIGYFDMHDYLYEISKQIN